MSRGARLLAMVNSLGLHSSMNCLFALAEHMSQAPGPISDYAVHSLPWWVFAAKISISNCQVAERWEERLVYLLHTAARIKTNSKVNWLRIILLLSILYSFYHGKITCNIRLYLQFHFYKMSLQGFSFFSSTPGQKLETRTRTNKNIHIHTHPNQNCVKHTHK